MKQSLTLLIEPEDIDIALRKTTGMGCSTIVVPLCQAAKRMPGVISARVDGDLIKLFVATEDYSYKASYWLSRRAKRFLAGLQVRLVPAKLFLGTLEESTLQHYLGRRFPTASIYPSPLPPIDRLQRYTMKQSLFRFAARLAIFFRIAAEETFYMYRTMEPGRIPDQPTSDNGDVLNSRVLVLRTTTALTAKRPVLWQIQRQALILLGRRIVTGVVPARSVWSTLL